MSYFRTGLTLLLVLLFAVSCDPLDPANPDPDPTDKDPTGTLDMAFVYRAQAVPASRVKKVDLCLARTADDLYQGIFFIQTNVSEAAVHYRFELPPGDYYYYASVICLCGGDSCLYEGFPGQYGLRAAGGKVTVEADRISNYTTQFQ
jgi:hypothetical protein